MRARMQTRWIGQREVSAIGLGIAVLAMTPGLCDSARVDATIHAALDSGITLIDTADSYAPEPEAFGHGERLVRRALSTYGRDTSHVLVATKVGHVRTPGHDWRLDGRPEYVRRACDASLRSLGTEAIGLYQYHRPDPAVPYEETLGALKQLRDSGKVQMVGVSNASLEQIATAREVLGERGLASVQNEFSLVERSAEPELRYCAEHGIAFLPWGPLGGQGSAPTLGWRRAELQRIARRRGASPQQVGLAWLLHLAPNVVPIPGASRPQTIRDSAAASGLELTAEELAGLAGGVSGVSPARWAGGGPAAR